MNRKKRYIALGLILFISFLSLQCITRIVDAEEPNITLRIKIYRIVMVDLIEEPPLPDYVDWHYFISVNSEGEWLEDDRVSQGFYIIRYLDIVHDFQVDGRYARIRLSLRDDDTYSRPDLADISSHAGGGIDNYKDFTRGTTFSGVYDVKMNVLMDNDEVTVKSGYYVTNGEYDGSTREDENDAELWFSISDDYEAPVAEAGPNRLCYTGETVYFDGSSSTASNGSMITKYEWDYDGDGKYDISGSSLWYTLKEKGNYTVYLKVTDSIGECDVDECHVQVTDAPPAASFVYAPASPTIEDKVQFNDTSTDLDGELESWHWDFGDGTTSTERNPSHRFEGKGTHFVTFTVEDDSDTTDSMTIPVTVVNIPPDADFSLSPMEVNHGETVTFVDGSSDPEGGVILYEWDFGDGHGAVVDSPTHSYDNPGEYTVSLTVRDDEGETDTASRTVFVSSRHPLTLVVSDLLGLPVSDVEVSVYSGGEMYASGFTDGRGVLTLFEVPTGDIIVKVSSLGFVATTRVFLTQPSRYTVKIVASIYTIGAAAVVLSATSVATYLFVSGRSPFKRPKPV
ncbi:MAG: PKD domain-containing protein [Candidatus Bathyarchaeota archaeon]|nr:MAG: PKD domain-containing protein [Candidatus Bathyarchaeota archaeon]